MGLTLQFGPLSRERHGHILAAGCQDASCAPPPIGTGGSKPGTGLSGVIDWVSGTEFEGDIPVFAPHFPVGQRVDQLIDEFWHPGLAESLGDDPRGAAVAKWSYLTQTEESRKWLSRTVRKGASGADLVILKAIHENFRRRFHDPDNTLVSVTRSTTREDRDPFAPDTFWKEQSAAPDKPGTGLTSWFLGRRAWDTPDGPDFRPYGHPPKEDPDANVPLPNIVGDVPVSDVLGWFGDMAHDGEVIVGRPGLVQRLLKGEPSDRANAALQASANPFAALEHYGFACRSKECAPPPVGKGGSLPGNSIPGIADQDAYNRYNMGTRRIQLLDAESAALVQQQVQDHEVVVRVPIDRLSDIINYEEPEDWELRSLHDPENEVGRSLRADEYLQHRDLYDAAVGFADEHVIHAYSEAELTLDPIPPERGVEEWPYGHLKHRTTPDDAHWYGEVELVLTDEARHDATFTITDSLNSGSVPLPIEGPIDPRAASLNGTHHLNFGRAYIEVQVRSPIEISPKHVKEIRVADPYDLQDVAHVLPERFPDTLVVIHNEYESYTMTTDELNLKVNP